MEDIRDYDTFQLLREREKRSRLVCYKTFISNAESNVERDCRSF